jgi:hypothetical protein
MRVPDLGLCDGSGRIVAEIRDSDDLVIQTEGKQHFCDAGSEGDDSLWSFGEIQLSSGIVDERPRGNVRHKRHTGQNALLPSFHELCFILRKRNASAGKDKKETEPNNVKADASTFETVCLSHPPYPGAPARAVPREGR